MLIKPLEGSDISVRTEGQIHTISVPQSKTGMSSYFVGAFTLFWLGGWAFGEVSVISTLISGQGGAGTAFLAFWLAAWTLGGLFAMMQVRRIFQKPVAESIRLEPGGLVHDSGIQPFQLPGVRTYPSWQSLFPKRIVTTIDRRQLGSLCLREGDMRNRLTVDSGATRLDLAVSATDVEREWLSKVISERYALAPVKLEA